MNPHENSTALTGFGLASRPVELDILLSGEARSMPHSSGEVVEGECAWGQSRHFTSHQLYAKRQELLALESDAIKLNFKASPREGRVLTQRQKGLSHSRNLTDSLTLEERTRLILSTLEPQKWHQRLPRSGEHPIFLVVDQRMTMFFGSSRYTKSVVAAKAAALIAWRAVGLQKPVGAIIFNDRDVVEIPSKTSRLRARLIVHVILSHNHALSPLPVKRSNPEMLNEALRRTAGCTDSLLFLISDASGWNDETYGLIEDLCKKNTVLVAFVYDPRQMDSQIHRSFSAKSATKVVGNGHFDRHCDGFIEGRPKGPLGIGSGLFPPEALVFRLNTHKDGAVQLLRRWENSDASSSPRSHSEGAISALMDVKDQPGKQ